MSLLAQPTRALRGRLTPLLLAPLLFASACDKSEAGKPQPAAPAARCSAEVVSADGRFWAVATASAGSPERPLRKQALKGACAQLCGQHKPTKKGCLARCEVDIEAAKVGARVSCKGTAK